MKKGYFITQWNHQRVPRYQCLNCGKSFSSHTFYRTYRQKKPYLNETIFKFYTSATTQRRLAKVLGVNLKTIVRKFLFLAENAERTHLAKLSQKDFDVTHSQFDEMLTFEHTRLKPISIALAVQKKDSKLIAIHVAQSHYQGVLSSVAFKKYGFREDQSQEARRQVLITLQSQIKSNCTLITDAKSVYQTEVACHVPSAKLEQIKNRGGRLQRLLNAKRRNLKDPMFELNLVAAKIRHDLSRMARKVWVTTKRKDRLQKHLMLFLASQNGYAIAA
ncbi:MAG: hypothetical protein ACKN9V_02890 [Pseudomonadota bacterium]